MKKKKKLVIAVISREGFPVLGFCISMLNTLINAAAQALLSEWMSTKIRLELEDDDDEEDAPCDPVSSERSSPALFASASPAHMDYDSFNGMRQDR